MAWRQWSGGFKSGESSAASSFARKLADEDTHTLASGTQDSWIELGPPSRGSITSSAIDASLLMDAQVSGKASRMSPMSLSSPCAKDAPAPNLLLVKEKLLTTDAMWDWSSRPEATPPADLRKASAHGLTPLQVAVQAELGSQLTTPPNSPAPKEDTVFGLRHSKLARSSAFRVEVVVGLVVSNVLSFVLGAVVGYYFYQTKTTALGDDLTLIRLD